MSARGGVLLRLSHVAPGGWVVVHRADDRQSDQLRKRASASLSHEAGAMRLDGPLADAEDLGDFLVRVPFDDQLQYLALARSQAGAMGQGRIVPAQRRVRHRLQGL